MKNFVLGKNDFAKISAIEGITLTSDMKKDFATFEKQNLSDTERRAFIVQKYGKA